MTKAEAAKKRYRDSQKNKEDEKSAKVNTTQKSKADAAKQRYAASSLGFDTLETDLKNLGKRVESVYNGWQSEDTMDIVLDDVNHMYQRLLSYQDYQKQYGGADLSENLNAYKSVLDEWGGLSELYGEHETADDYNKAVKDAEIAEEELENMKKADLKALQSDIDLLQGSYDSIKDTYDNWHIPTVGTVDKETTKKTGVITYYKDKKAEKEAIKARDEWLASRIQRDNTGWAEHNNATPEDIKNKKYHIGDTLDEYAAFINKKKQYKVNAERQQNIVKMSSVGDKNSENYDKDFEYGVETGDRIIANEEMFDAPLPNAYEHDTDEYGYMQAYQLISWRNHGVDEDSIELATGEYYYLEDEELELLKYYIGKDGELLGEQSKKYLDSIKETLRIRKSNAIYKKYLKDNDALEILYSNVVGLDQFGSGISNVFNFSDDYITPSTTQMVGSLVRNDLKDVGPKLPEFLGGASLGQSLYDAGQTFSNMVPSIAAGVAATYINPALGSWVSSGLIGASSAGNTYQEALNNGLDKTEARTYSTLVGISEMALSKVLGKLGGNVFEGKLKTLASGIKNGALRFAANFGISAVTEGVEEGLQAILEPQLENIAVGYTKNEFEDTDWGEVAYQTFLGSVTGGAFGAVGAGIDRIKNVSQAVGIYDTAFKKAELLDFALSLPQDSNAYKMAQKYKGGKLSRGKVYNLMTASENYIADQFLQQGERNNVLELARATLKKQTGIKLSVGEIELLSKSSLGQQVLKGDWKATAVQQRAKSGVKLTKAEQKLLNTPDSELTAEQRAEKKSIINRLKTQSDSGIINNNQDTVIKFTAEQKRAAILDYKSGTAYRINAMLRENAELDESEQEFVDILDEALRELPTYEGEVYRNLTFDDFGGQEAFDAFLEQHSIDKLVYYNQFILENQQIYEELLL